MRFHFFASALAAFALLGAGCTRTTAPEQSPTNAAQEAPVDVMPEAQAPVLPSETLSTPQVVGAPAPTSPGVEGAPAPEPTLAPSPAPSPLPAPAPTPRAVAPAPAPAPATHAVTIQNFSFAPATLTVKVGDTVVWTQKDSAPHTVTSDSGSELSSAILSPDQTYAHTFTTKGTFPYHCKPHPFMKATVVVE